MTSLVNDSTKTLILGQVSKKVGTAIGNWLQTSYPNIQRPTCPWCHAKGVELHRCHVGPRKVDIIRAEMEMLWKLSTAMGQTPNMDIFVQRITERVKQDHNDGLTRIEIACGACNPYFEYMQLSKLDELNELTGRDRKIMWNMYKKRVDNPRQAKKQRVEPAITKYFTSSSTTLKDSSSEEEESSEEDESSDDEDDQDRILKMKAMCERFGCKIHGNSGAWRYENSLRHISRRKYVHTKTLKEIYALMLGKAPLGPYANDRKWLHSAIEKYMKNRFCRP